MAQTIFQKLSALPAADRERLSSPQVLGALERLEQQYGLKLVTPYLTYALGEQSLEHVLAGLVGADESTRSVISTVFQQLGTQSSPPTETKASPTSASVIFSTEDEQEINQVQTPIGSPESDHLGLVQAVLRETGQNPADVTMRKRLENIILARVRGVRDDLETIEVLEKPPKVGGMEMTAEQAQALVKAIRTQMDAAAPGARPATMPTKLVFPVRKPFVQTSPVSLLERARHQSATPAPSQSPDPTPPPQAPVVPTAPAPIPLVATPPAAKPLPAVPARSAPKMGEEDGLPVVKFPRRAGPAPMPGMRPAAPKPIVEPKLAETVSPAIPAPSARPASPAPLPSSPAVSPAPPAEPASARPAPSSRPLPPPLPRPASVPAPVKASVSPKPSLDGVRLVKQLMGPIDELLNMTLIEFRRLGDPRQAMAQIIEKVGLLERESYTQRLEGIAAWHQSEVCRFYRLLGQESMSQNRPVADIISERQQAGKPTLSAEEFDAVMELNSRLRY